MDHSRIECFLAGLLAEIWRRTRHGLVWISRRWRQLFHPFGQFALPVTAHDGEVGGFRSGGEGSDTREVIGVHGGDLKGEVAVAYVPVTQNDGLLAHIQPADGIKRVIVGRAAVP